MRQPKNHSEYGKGGCCPDDWNHTPDLTGDYVMDGSIKRCRNKDAAARLEDHLTGDVAYQKSTPYKRTSI